MVIVYTAILGGCDSLKPAPGGAECICFTDTDQRDANGWKFIVWPKESWQVPDPRREAWRLRCVPHKIFNTYDTVIWVDGSLTLLDLPRLLHDSAVSALSGLKHDNRTDCYHEGRELIDIGQSDPASVNVQLDKYRRAGFKPMRNRLTIACLLVRNNTAKVTAFNELWDAEIQKHPGDNTQLSLDYCAWKQGLSWHHLEGGRHHNPYASHDGADHKRRRKPYR